MNQNSTHQTNFLSVTSVRCNHHAFTIFECEKIRKYTTVALRIHFIHIMEEEHTAV